MEQLLMFSETQSDLEAAMKKRELILKKAFEILARPEYGQGIRSTALIKQVAQEIGENRNTCSGNLYNLPDQFPDKVLRPHRGLFILKENEKLLEEVPEEAKEPKGEGDKCQYHESALYVPAMNHLKEEGECTHAIALGGSSFGGKWGTPDVLGVIRAGSEDAYRPIIEIVAVEVKKEREPVVALGQAMAYKLFSHRTWLVLPEEADIDRLLGISISANIGLVIFKKNGDDFDFRTLNRPRSVCPDLTEVNGMLNKLRSIDRAKYNDLIRNER